jgi:hypothetical protein
MPRARRLRVSSSFDVRIASGLACSPPSTAERRRPPPTAVRRASPARPRQGPFSRVAAPRASKQQAGRESSRRRGYGYRATAVRAPACRSSDWGARGERAAGSMAALRPRPTCPAAVRGIVLQHVNLRTVLDTQITRSPGGHPPRCSADGEFSPMHGGDETRTLARTACRAMRIAPANGRQARAALCTMSGARFVAGTAGAQRWRRAATSPGACVPMSSVTCSAPPIACSCGTSRPARRKRTIRPVPRVTSAVENLQRRKTLHAAGTPAPASSCTTDNGRRQRAAALGTDVIARGAKMGTAVWAYALRRLPARIGR